MALGSISIDEKWGWYSMIDRLSNGDITKHDLVYERNYIECLNLLSFYHERDKYMEQLNNAKNNTLR
jgi:hypothetical protein